MITLTITDLPDEVHRRLCARAAQHGRSASAEARTILVDAVKGEMALVHGSKSPGTVSTVPPCTGLLERAAFEQKSAWYADFCSAALGSCSPLSDGAPA